MVSEQTILIYHTAAFPKTRNSSESDLLLVAHEGDEDDKPAGNPNPKVPHRWRVTIMMALAFVLVIGPLVFVHEFGHYIVARWFGVKADEFSIGFGREIAGFTDKRGTRWKFGWLPLGGYVRFAGDMNPASQPDPDWLALPPEERAKTFQAKKLWQRALIVFAGPATNFLAAILIIAAFATINGVDRRLSIAGPISPGSAFQPSDKA